MCWLYNVHASTQTYHENYIDTVVAYTAFSNLVLLISGNIADAKCKLIV